MGTFKPLSARDTAITRCDMGTGKGRKSFGSRVLPAFLMRCLCLLIFIPRLGADPVGCVPPRVEDADQSVTLGSVTVGSVVTYTCKPGFYLSGTKTLECISDGEWSDTAPECKPYCGRPPPYGNAHVSPRYVRRELYFVDQFAHFTCDGGFVSPANGFYMTCERSANGLAGWVQTSDLACRATRCDTFEGLKDGVIQGSNEVGSSITFQCNKGLLVGDETLTCLESGKWSGDAPTCQPFCTDALLQQPSHASISKNYRRQGKYPIGSSITFSCDLHYRVNDAGFDFNVSCRKDEIGAAYWSAENPCVPAECPRKCSAPNANAINCEFEHFPPGIILILKCNEGYRAESNESAQRLTCKQDKNGYPYWDDGGKIGCQIVKTKT